MKCRPGKEGKATLERKEKLQGKEGKTARDRKERLCQGKEGKALPRKGRLCQGKEGKALPRKGDNKRRQLLEQVYYCILPELPSSTTTVYPPTII